MKGAEPGERLDVSFSDIWDELNFALMVEYEAQKSRWGLWGNTIYANLRRSNSEVSGIEIEPTVNALWQGAGGLYRLGTWDLADASDKSTPSVTVDTYLGVRYTYLDLRLDHQGQIFGRGSLRRESDAGRSDR